MCDTKSDQVQEPPGFDIPSKCWVKLSANKHAHRKSVVGYEPFLNPKRREFVIKFEVIPLSVAFEMLFKLRYDKSLMSEEVSHPQL